ncbi:ORF962 [White spot syndrome virus]|uniref:ORF962 n=1 Tax=White spot syndrome virus TaxID=342409 RepID=A0A2D3I6D3_9VIRU|nr:ORF962 [White spot syndrome virus]
MRRSSGSSSGSCCCCCLLLLRRRLFLFCLRSIPHFWVLVHDFCSIKSLVGTSCYSCINTPSQALCLTVRHWIP